MDISNYNQNYNKWFLTKVKQAIKDYRMINPEDHVVIGLSGGKDSLALAFILALLKKFSHLSFHLTAVNIHPGWDADNQPLAEFCQKLNLPFFEENTQIAEIVFDARKEKNPCALCSNLRRGALVKITQKLGANKLALGHHGDDAIETLLLNSTLGGKLKSFTPVIYYPDSQITVIRPLIYLREKTINSLSQKQDFPVQSSPCPLDKKTKRQDMKNLLLHMEKVVPKCGDNLINALKDQWQRESF
ncbi:MAG: tRNA 2-thiocytidine biosynthesis TtcA family protein [Bacillota bacterium]|jgi:tRNA 2-thiocytidine biosynthesis protein TtcA